MQIVYFIANAKTNEITLKSLQDLGLGYAFDKTPAMKEVTGAAIDGHRGLVIGHTARGLGYYPDRQSWQPMAGVDGVWIGIDTKEPPTPREMVRESWLSTDATADMVNANLLIIESHDLVANGYFWPVPVARGWSLTEDGGLAWLKTLPRSVEYVCEGVTKKFQPGEVQRKFLRLERIASQIHELWQTNQIPDNYYDLAAEVLGIAYRLGPQEMAMMELVDSRVESVADLLWIVVDDAGYHEQVKKKAALDQDAGTSGNAA